MPIFWLMDLLVVDKLSKLRECERSCNKLLNNVDVGTCTLAQFSK